MFINWKIPQVSMMMMLLLFMIKVALVFSLFFEINCRTDLAMATRSLVLLDCSGSEYMDTCLSHPPRLTVHRLCISLAIEIVRLSNLQMGIMFYSSHD